ncbi:DUF1549 and DUF1553 domain-containing protein [Frigoriglobus tundricola]|uniref:BIG2 domain-containing protein n=1 Tax=Frigoriglobus tundricola TaxID=2774151 RepID=A0A6M5Z423_9BACT|nr:DUF1549 and DUF1553 domain-containing protein [Frigoriglobus tundricola]QJX01148.1 hypothetical protein FTUN_8787 [Frigoriglobus tundricola]
MSFYHSLAVAVAVALVGAAGPAVAGAPPDLAAPKPNEPIRFQRQVVPALAVAGCNAGACHGTPSGKNGFKLSLRGFDPLADFTTLTRDATGRRVNVAKPDDSLILLKGRGKVPHEGGARLKPGEPADVILRAWIAQGVKADPPDLPAHTRLEVLPGNKVLRAPARTQPVMVNAHFADRSVAEVSRLTVFRSSDESVAKVDANGLVTFARTGEVAIQTKYLNETVSVRLTFVEPDPTFVWPDPPTNNSVDELLFAKLKLLQIPPSELSTDAEFLRRVYLDVLGVLPTPAEADTFLAGPDPKKRSKLIDGLLDRPEFADYWALKWADILNVNRRAVQAKGAYLYVQWLRQHFTDNTPFDKVVRELLTASGSTFLNPPASFFRNDRRSRPADDLGRNTAQLFLGIRMSCAQCHNHPFERWTQDDYYGLAAFFARVKDRPDPLYPRLNRFNLGAIDVFHAKSGEVIHPRTNDVQPPRFLGGELPQIAADADRRVALADWITRKDNPFFARATVNRVWYHLLGRGLVDPVDDFRDSNPAASDEVLDALAKDFVDHNFDVKRVIRTVLNSRTYQLTAATNDRNRDDERFFSHAVTKLLPAEVLLDALSSSTEVPEPFEGVKLGTRATQLPDGDVFHHPFLKAFGQPARETSCECERQGDTSLGHALQLINGPTLKVKLADPANRVGRLLKDGKSDTVVLRELYLATLTRRPSAAEEAAVLKHLAATVNKRQAWEDVQWALINTKEFLFRH